MSRLSIDKTRQVIVAGVPTCVELLRLFQSKGSWLRLPPEIPQIRKGLNIEDYVLLYDDLRKIGVCFLLAFVSKEEFKELGEIFEALDVADQQIMLDKFASDMQEIGDAIEGTFDFSLTDAERQKQKEAFNALPVDEQQELLRIGRFLWTGFLAGFHNIISTMVHGEPLTSLVPKALAGDDEAFCKAVQIDRQIYSHHPYFRERLDLAHARGEAKFLEQVSYRLSSPGARGKIQYPGLWTVLAMLDTLGWLDDLTAEQILDICDEAGLHRFENRIEDAGALRKRVRAYRKMQKTALLSSH